MNFHKFTNDYSEGAHPRILEAMINANLTQNPGYGLDSHCEKARELIIKRVQRPRRRPLRSGCPLSGRRNSDK